MNVACPCTGNGGAVRCGRAPFTGGLVHGGPAGIAEASVRPTLRRGFSP